MTTFGLSQGAKEIIKGLAKAQGPPAIVVVISSAKGVEKAVAGMLECFHEPGIRVSGVDDVGGVLFSGPLHDRCHNWASMQIWFWGLLLNNASEHFGAG
jgi:hypothetical protein